MTTMPADKLSTEKIQQLLAAVGVRSQEDTGADADAPEYDWRQCQYFGLAQMQRLSEFSEQVATGCGEVFTRLFNRPFEVSIVSTTQQFVKELYDPQAESTDYAVGFGASADDSFGFVLVDRPTAMAWTGQLLGGSSEAEEERELSTLEESLLVDIAGNVVAAFSASYTPANLFASTQTSCGQWPVDWDGEDEVFKITFQVKPQDAEEGRQGSILVKCSQLDAVAGQDAAGQTLSGDQVRDIVLGHISDIPVPITAKLGTVKVDLADVLGMEVDDILILDKKVNEPVELLLGQTPFRYGRPAQSEGNYAISIM
ncbi:MAG: FliM/FliN family flagellar motor switch protein [Planctomycetota bacterium]|jgi:flagellar motor switch protein FliM